MLGFLVILSWLVLSRPSFWGLMVVTCYTVAALSFSVLVIIVLDGTARHFSMSPTPFRRSHYVSGNIILFYY